MLKMHSIRKIGSINLLDPAPKRQSSRLKLKDKIYEVAMKLLASRYVKSIAMGVASFTAVLVVLLVVCTQECWSEDVSLRQVAVVFRHGERSPRIEYSNSPHTWPEGLDQLTEKGKTHMVKLGMWLRDRYVEFLGKEGKEGKEHVDKDRMEAWTSAIERCILSAQAVIAGLLLPKGETHFSEELKNQTLPLHMLPPDEDGMILMSKECPRRHQEMKMAVPKEVIDALNKENDAMFQFLSENSGENVSDVNGARAIYDALLSEHAHGLDLPEWSKEVFPGKLQVVVAKAKALLTNSEALKRLRGGPILLEITTHMKEQSENASDEQGKMLLYSVHEQTIIDMIRSMGFDELLEADYGSCVIFELLLDEATGKWIVRVAYFNMKHLPEPKPLDVPGCGEECDLDTFIESLIPVMPQDLDEECKVT